MKIPSSSESIYVFVCPLTPMGQTCFLMVPCHHIQGVAALTVLVRDLFSWSWFYFLIGYSFGLLFRFNFRNLSYWEFHMLMGAMSSFFKIQCKYPLKILYHEIVKHFISHWKDFFFQVYDCFKKICWCWHFLVGCV